MAIGVKSMRGMGAVARVSQRILAEVDISGFDPKALRRRPERSGTS
jgi:hypothetical protein